MEQYYKVELLNMIGFTPIFEMEIRAHNKQEALDVAYLIYSAHGGDLSIIEGTRIMSA